MSTQEDCADQTTQENCANQIASMKNPITNMLNVIYIADELGLYAADGKYVTVCEAHEENMKSTSLQGAKTAMKDATQWCIGCQLICTVTV